MMQQKERSYNKIFSGSSNKVNQSIMNDHKQNRFRVRNMIAISIAFLQFGITNAQSGNNRIIDATPVNSGISTFFGPIKQINAGVLNVGYAEAGPADGSPVI